jgi:hypothetical protein
MHPRRGQHGRLLDRALAVESNQRRLHNATKPSVSIAPSTRKVATAYAVDVGASGRVRGGTLDEVEMSNPRSMMGFVGRYASLAGKSCCCGRSWVGLNRSLAKHGDDPSASSCETPACDGSDVSDEVLAGDLDRDEPTFVASSSSGR